MNCQSKEAELFLLLRLVILFCFRAGIRNITNSTSLPLMVVALGKNRRLAPDWDLPTEAVQSGLETLRSHLELVQGDAALLYEMT